MRDWNFTFVCCCLGWKKIWELPAGENILKWRFFLKQFCSLYKNRKKATLTIFFSFVLLLPLESKVFDEFLFCHTKHECKEKRGKSARWKCSQTSTNWISFLKLTATKEYKNTIFIQFLIEAQTDILESTNFFDINWGEIREILFSLGNVLKYFVGELSGSFWKAFLEI